ncbi:MAG: hypothetical protein C0424_10890 [Sphingobacteriaceae bacterium]|nr:hypothetical protein [Sphingobacteriaceae bacterium]
MEHLLKLQRYSDGLLSTSVLLHLLADYNSPYDKINEWVKQGVLVQLRRGLYALSEELGLTKVEPFLIANQLYGPSYVSLDTALAYWGLIPERVYVISSVSMRPTKLFHTSRGVFSYKELPATYFSLGISQVSLSPKQNVLVASKEKCLCDKLVCTSGLQLRSRKQAMRWLIDDLRIDQDQLRDFDTTAMEAWLTLSPKRESIVELIQSIKGL